ncbi:hypothetical protein [Sinosporangium album]|nr:hypothetical protein [Sinosporangium album]
MTDADLITVRTYPSELRKVIWSHIGLSNPRSVSGSAATALARVLKGNDSKRRASLICALSSYFKPAFENHDGLSTEECIKLFHRDKAPGMLPRTHLLAQLLVATAHVDEAFIDLILADIYQHDLALSPLALALLVGSAERMGPEAGAAVREGWRELRDLYPGLPELPVTLQELRDAVLSPPSAPDDDIVNDEPAVNAGGADTGTGRLSIEKLREDLDRLRATLPAAAEAAGRIRQALKDGERPLDQDVETVLCGIRDFDDLRGRLESRQSISDVAVDTVVVDAVAVDAVAVDTVTVTAVTVDAFQRAIDRLDFADSRRRKIRSLARISGPAFIEALLQEVREAALTESPSLEPLADLIELADDPDGFLQIYEAEQRFRELAPQRWLPLATAAHRRLIVIDGEDVPVPVREPSTAEPTMAAVTVPAPADDPVEPSSSVNRPPEPAPSPKLDDGLADLDSFIERRLHPQPTQGQNTAPAVEEPPTAKHARPEEPTPVVRGLPEDEEDDPVPVSPPAPESSPDTAGDTATDTGGDTGGDTVGALEAEAFALRSSRFGLAAWVRDAAGGSAAEVNARRCAAIAAEMSEFAGRLSAAFAESATGLSMRALGDDTAGQLLAWAAALRACLVHPTSEAAQLLDELSPFFSSYPGLAAYGDGFGKLAKAGAYLMPGLSGRMYDTSKAENRRREASEAASRVLSEGPAQTIKYAPATDVWKNLLQNDSSGPGRLLAVAAADDGSRVHDVRQELDRLRAGSVIDRLVDEEAKARASRRGGSRIHSGARARLIAKIDKTLDVVAAWVSAVRELESSRVDDSGVAWVVRHLTDLRATVNQNRRRSDDELARLAGSTDPLVAAAAASAAALIGDTLRLLEGGRPQRAESPSAHVLNGDLLLSSVVRLTVDTLIPAVKPSLDDLAPLCRPDGRNWRDAFEARAVLGDHEGTRALLSVLTYEDSALASDLRLRRDKLVDAARHERSDRVEDLHDRIAEWRRDGVLPEVMATRFVTRLQALDSDDRDDFDVIADGLAGLEREALKVRDGEMTSELGLLTTLSAENANVAAVQERIKVYIEAGDLTTAREFMAQAKAGKELPELSDTVDHLERFFPAFPQAFEDMSAVWKGGQRGREGDEWLQKLKDALHTGNEVSDPALRELLLGAGLSVSEIPRGRRGVASHGLRNWKSMAQGPKAAGNLKSALTAVLQMIGLEGVQEPANPEQMRQWIALNQVQRIGDSILPAFGSRMSPAGDRLRLLLVWKPPGPQQVMEWLKDQPEDQTVIVFYFGVLSAEQRRQLAALARRRPTPVAAVLDDAAITYLACVPDANWVTTQRLLAPFTAANPYTPIGEVPEEMFYGRQDQLREVTSPTGSSFVYGGRQLGKSALLRKAERKVRETDSHRTVISEIIQNIGKVAKVTALWPMLAGRLVEAGVLPTSVVSLSDPADICREVRDWIDGDPARQLLILLDEADEFLNRDARDEAFANVITMRNLMNETNNRVKVVFAGLHQTVRFESLSNQPLAHLGTPIAVGPLDPQDAYDLLTEPLAALGFRFPARVASRVIAEANNAPALIQLFAAALLTRLRRISTPHAKLPYEITRQDVDAVWRDNKLARGFRDRFEWTLNLDKRYKVIAYTVAFHALDMGTDVTLTAKELRSECQEWWPRGFGDSTSDGFRSLLDECVNLGVLAADGERYRLRTPHILNLLGGAEEVQTMLDQADSFELPDSFDAQSYRYAYKTHGERSPLTGSQVTRLLSPRNALHLVAGSYALQIDRVATALEDAAEQHKQAQTLRVGAGGLTMEGAVQRAVQSSKHDVLIIDLAGQPYKKATMMARAAAKAISMQTKGTLSVTLIASPQHASEWLATGRRVDAGEVGDWTSTAELIELQPFNKAAVRQWMHEEELGFQDEPSQEALLRITGGWPLLISKVIHALRGGNADRDHALEACQAHVDQAPEEFVRSTGVLTDTVIRTAWRTLVETDESDTPEGLAEWLNLAAAGDETHPLSQSGLHEEGYTSTSDLVEVLRILGALRVRSDGRLQPEPVLMKATQMMGPLADD